MASRVLGLVREMVMGNLLGASHDTDAFIVAFRIPNLVRDLFAEGAMSSAFVPTFTARLTKEGRASAWRLASNVMTTLLIVTGVLVVVGMTFATPLVTLVAGDYADTPGKIERTVLLTRIMLPFLTFVALAAAAMGMLNSLRHFFIPALSPAMFNVASIVCVLGLWPVMPRFGLPGVAALAIGTLAGGILQLAIQWPLLRREGFHYRPVVDWRDEGLRRMLVLMGPGTVGMAATQVNVLVNTTLATQIDGAASWLSYAFRLMYLPIGLFGVSIAAATLPEVSRQGGERDHGAMRDTITHALSLMLMLNIPATVGLIVLGVPIIRVIFEHGEFSPTDTLRSAAALQFYAAGLVGYSVVRIASPVFYAIGQSRTPVIVSVVSVLLNAVLNVLLMQALGYRGLALGTSIAAIINALLLLFLLQRAVHGLDVMRVLGSLARIALASAAMGVAAAATDRALLAWLPGDARLLQIIRLTGDISVALLVLAGGAWLLRIPEFHESVAMVRRKLRRGR
jgi:putative peptidoglycan lipid II flippase